MTPQPPNREAPPGQRPADAPPPSRGDPDRPPVGDQQPDDGGSGGDGRSPYDHEGARQADVPDIPLGPSGDESEPAQEQPMDMPTGEDEERRDAKRRQ